MPTPRLCVVRTELAAKVAKAVQGIYDAKTDLRRVNGAKLDTAKFVLHLAETRQAERKALSDLDKHRKEHGC